MGRKSFKKAIFLIVISSFLGMSLACGEQNLFEGFADEDSREAKVEAGQMALDKEDCQTALNMFEQAYGGKLAADVSDVEARINLAGAYLCLAGFSYLSFIDVAANFGAGTVASTQLFNKIADLAIRTLHADWQTNIGYAKDLLDTDPSVTPPSGYAGNADAGFNLAITVMVEGVLTIVDILNFINGVVDCSASQGSPSIPDCQITSTESATIINDLENAPEILSSLGASEVADAMNRVVNDLKAVDSNSADTTVCQDLVDYLDSQGMSGASCV